MSEAEVRKWVVYKSVKLARELRSLDCLGFWKGAGNMLPGDRKADLKA